MNTFEMPQFKKKSDLEKYTSESLELQDEIQDMISALREHGILVSDEVIEKEFLAEIKLAKDSDEDLGIEPIFDRVYHIHNPKKGSAETIH